jgi:ADP-heptose:LPS heptosyltransferase
MELAQSIALVSAVRVLVSIDSSFLHAAAALAVPVVALFGPIDGRIRTIHVPKVELLQETAQFPCAPCWRNEDEPCKITGQTGLSPCMASIPFQQIIAAVHRLMKPDAVNDRNPVVSTSDSIPRSL